MRCLQQLCTCSSFGRLVFHPVKLPTSLCCCTSSWHSRLSLTFQPMSLPLRLCLAALTRNLLVHLAPPLKLPLQRFRVLLLCGAVPTGRGGSVAAIASAPISTAVAAMGAATAAAVGCHCLGTAAQENVSQSGGHCWHSAPAGYCRCQALLQQRQDFPLLSSMHLIQRCHTGLGRTTALPNCSRSRCRYCCPTRRHCRHLERSLQSDLSALAIAPLPVLPGCLVGFDQLYALVVR